MSEWHITPEYIINNWTEEKLDLMIAKLVERKTRIAAKSLGDSENMLFARASNLIEVVKK